MNDPRKDTTPLLTIPNPNQSGSYVASGPPRRFIEQFFPTQYCEIPKAPAEFKNVMHINVDLTFGWKDKLRLLISGRAKVILRVVCENEVGRSVTGSVSYIPAPARRDR